jgi:hypothetical protein
VGIGLVTATQSNEEFGDTKTLQEKTVSGVEEDMESLKDIEILLLLLKNRILHVLLVPSLVVWKSKILRFYTII